MLIYDLDTPALIVDLDILERNLEKVAAYCKTHKLDLRPHVKTHKITEIAKAQIASGALGITVAKVGEAEVMVDAGISDILVAYPVIGNSKLGRLMHLARNARISVALDSETAAQGISQKAVEYDVQIDLLVEVDVGYHRTGVPIDESLIQLARLIHRLPQVRLRGVMYFPGHLRGTPDQMIMQIQELKESTTRIRHMFDSAGLPLEVFSGGNTPALFYSHLLDDGVTEIRPGTYVFNDRNTLLTGTCNIEDCAASVLVTVVSTAVPNQLIVDAGSKTFAFDRVLSFNRTDYGLVQDDPDLLFTEMTEEHGFFDCSNSRRKYEIGDRFRVLMNHVCPCVNLQDVVYGIRGEKVETCWRVAARGKTV